MANQQTTRMRGLVVLLGMAVGPISRPGLHGAKKSGPSQWQKDQHCNRTIYFAAACAEIPENAAGLTLITVPHPGFGEQSFRLPP
jgi:hypothetical protein